MVISTGHPAAVRESFLEGVKAAFLVSQLNRLGQVLCAKCGKGFTSIEVAGLVLVIVAALTFDAREPAAAPATEPAVMAAAALLFFVYLGFEEIANMAEEVHNPSRDLPIALFISLAVTTGL